MARPFTSGRATHPPAERTERPINMPATNTTWRKSSRSAEGTSGQCVELAALSGLRASEWRLIRA
ncbi:DUF397 domain-containing protein [Actinomadura sp. KC216]|nr:DUF397 domain-containing protein [Actinomadura sp. KC216]